ncbi:MAG: hypothetical protein Q8926_14415, partial [Bacteroidota bacterium]|nr:hypothetical protein [Bacteroidota bacterium]
LCFFFILLLFYRVLNIGFLSNSFSLTGASGNFSAGTRGTGTASSSVVGERAPKSKITGSFPDDPDVAAVDNQAPAEDTKKIYCRKFICRLTARSAA